MYVNVLASIAAYVSCIAVNKLRCIMIFLQIAKRLSANVVVVKAQQHLNFGFSSLTSVTTHVPQAEVVSHLKPVHFLPKVVIIARGHDEPTLMFLVIVWELLAPSSLA
jgi:hypothetical protein